MLKKKKIQWIIGAVATSTLLIHTSFSSLAAGISAAMPKVSPYKGGQAISEAGIAAGVAEVSQAITEQKELVRQREEEEARRKAEEEENARRRAEEEQKRRQTEQAAAYANDRTLLAALIHCEAGGEPYDGQVAVGAVVMNRVGSGEFPNSIREVVYQSGQFGPAMTGKLERVLEAGTIYESCYQAADAAIAGQNPVGNALYFGDGRDYGILIGGHWFHP